MRLLFVLGAFFTIAGVLAIPIDDGNLTQILYVESRVTNTSDTYIINWSEDGEEHTADGIKYGIRRVQNWTFWLKELDPHVSQEIRVLDYTTLQIRVRENPADPNPTPDLPLHACVNGTTIKHGKRFEEEHDFCEGDTEYYLERIPFNVWWTIDFDEHPTYEWWLGEGQGGGANGVDLCDAGSAGAQARYNQTNGTSAYQFHFEGRGVISGTQTGCLPVNLIWYNLLNGSWAQIKTFNTSSYIHLDCNGTACIENTPLWDTWYSRFPVCDAVGNVSVRTRFKFTRLGVPYLVYSATTVIECLEEPAPPTVGGLGSWWLYAFPFLLFAMVMFLLRGRFKNREKARD